MKQLIHWLEHSFAPKMNKINNNVWVTTLKDSIMQVLPFILLGSIFCFLTVLEKYLAGNGGRISGLRLVGQWGCYHYL